MLDMLDPWNRLEQAYRVIAPGGVLICYVTTTTQLSRLAEALRESGVWTEPDVQETLEHALGTLLRAPVSVVGAGRTDTGVHASFYVAHFDWEGALFSPEQIAYKLNRILGKDIAVYRLYPVSPGMHARFSALSRTYKYYIDKTKDPFTCEYAWRAHPLPDIGRLIEACRILF